MASVNWTMLTPTSSPVPLPQEKFCLSLSAVALALFPCPPGASLSAKPPADGRGLLKCDKGTVWVSNKRVVYVKAGASGNEGGASSSGQPQELRTLSVPLSHFLDGRLVQPWFSAQSYEALCVPSDGGGLSTSEPHLLRLSFHESGGGQFYETVAEMKDRMGAAGTGGRGTPVEALPLYQPTEGSSSTVAPAPGSASSPSQDDQEAAAVARSAEAEEEQATRAGAQSISPPPVGTEAERARDGPPEYVP